jgi:hypothetical protein
MRGGRGASRKAGGPVVWWRHDKRHARRGPTQGWGPRARAERTENMYCMSLTLEVSQFSGWLKAFAFCRVGGRACVAGGRGASREAGGPGVVAAHKRHVRGNGPTQGLGAKGTRGAHGEHGEHGRDARGVKA